jgi:lipoyl(octanoyl) transferase
MHWEWLGRVAYADALALQTALVAERRADVTTDRLLLLEHPHVITLGSSAHSDHVRLDEAELRLLGIDVFETGRGGDVTYHGPGQLVGYPILRLAEPRRDLHRYVRDLEEVILRALAEFDIAAQRRSGRTGVWVGDEKVAAIGIRVSSGWITSHGFALNVNTDLDFFDAIVPCGIRDAGVTSMARCIGDEISLQHVATRVAMHFDEVFGMRSDEVSAKSSRKTCSPV